MKITIVGTGYVGLVSGTCFADLGNDVLCVDLDAEKVAALMDGRCPIYEPGLEPLLRQNIAAGRLRFSTDPIAGVEHGTVQVIAVGTPANPDGSADLRFVLAAARDIGRHMRDYRVGLLARGARIAAYDPVAMPEARRVFAHENRISFAEPTTAALDGADALIIVTEWKEFRSPDVEEIKRRLKSPVIFDGRNLYDPVWIRDAGLEYFSIGRT